MLVAQLIVVATVLLILEIPLLLVYSRHEHDRLRSGLQRDAAALAAVTGEVFSGGSPVDIGALAARFVSASGEGVVVVDAAGGVLTPPSVYSRDAAFVTTLDAALAGRSVSEEIDGLIVIAVPIGSSGQPAGAVLTARSDEPVDRRVRRMGLVLAGIALAMLGVTAIVGHRLSRWVAEPLQLLESRAEALGRGDLRGRAATDRGPPEVVALAGTFNEMAERLDELVTSQRRFVADASHQLRTPLTALRLRLENLDEASPGSVAAARDAALAEVVRLTRLVDGLLALARADGHRPDREPVAVDEVLLERHQAWAPLAAEQGVDLRVASDPHDLTAALVPGHLEQILDNLVDNALDASRPGTTVDLSARRCDGVVEVHVIDEGRGMTDDERAHAFDPFWRGPGSRDGTGLGLAIVDQLARASRGTVALERSATGGIDAVVRFPAAAPPARS
jgi:signal transduction histidine kinase